MKADGITALIVFVGSVLLSSISQLILKTSADKQHGSTIGYYINRSVILAYTLFIGSSLAVVYAYKHLPLSLGPLLESLGYVFVGALSFVFLKERVSRRVLLGMLMIITGACLSII
jgi:drug/metabolite transporter (DMT)-like permease